MTENEIKRLNAENEALRSQVQRLAAFKDVILATGTVRNLNQLFSDLVTNIGESLPCYRALIFVVDDDDGALKFGAINTPVGSPVVEKNLKSLSITVFNASDDPVIGSWVMGRSYALTPESSATVPALSWLVEHLDMGLSYSVPLVLRSRLVGVLIIDDRFSEAYLPPPALEERLQMVASGASIVVENALAYGKMVVKSAVAMQELQVLRQIDRELNDTIELNRIFTMTLDWALRFTNAHVAAIQLYDERIDELRLVAQYGHEVKPDLEMTLRMQRGGIAYRVARSARPEAIPDVSADPDYIRVSSQSQSCMSVPVLREERVIAVISVESRKLNAFTDQHVDFVEKLAARAGVAIDNARLFYETEREREKLSHILNNIVDVVIACGLDGRLIHVNPAAVSTFRLYPNASYVGRQFAELFAESNIMPIYRRAQSSGEPVLAEAEMPNERVYHINMTPYENIGWIIVMHDITPFKEMDQLKSQLIATVSHDLKQPLSVMNGYTELLMMHNKLDNIGINFIEMVRKSIQNMRQLIDDLLDLAKIESGIKLDVQPVQLKDLIDECVESLAPAIQNKNMTTAIEVDTTLSPVAADPSRLQQIMLNLIGNAVKYTQPEGLVRIKAEQRDTMMRISIQDNGMGISPEDQAHIFERFYRVRRPETDSIEGTGLGLAIVKSLVEAHSGQIGLESRLGEGSTFYVLLPLHGEQSFAAV